MMSQSNRQVWATCFALAALSALIVVMAVSTTKSVTPEPDVSSDQKQQKEEVKRAKRTVLTEKDFTFVGSYTAQRRIAEGQEGGELNWGMGFTHRYVGDELRFLTLGYVDGTFRLVELAAPAKLGEEIKTASVWKDIWQNEQNKNTYHGLWWDEAKGRLWTTGAEDYPDDKRINNTKSLMTRKLEDGGKISEVRGVWGLQKISARRIYGGVTAVPSWFQEKYKVGPYAVGFGGYASRMAQGYTTSLGPTLYTIPEPTTYKDGTDVPTTKYKILMDHGIVSAEDWYRQGKPTTFDRGVRNSDVANYYDGGDKRKNVSSPPTDPPAKGAYWLSPAPDRLGRWVWGDSALNTGNWIDGPKKHGFIIVPTFASGKVWYQGSTLNYERKTFEIQVFDPDHLGEAAKGTRKPWNVKPSSRWEITKDLKGFSYGRGGFVFPGAVIGATFDPKTKRLYVCANAKEKTYETVIHVYDVDY